MTSLSDMVPAAVIISTANRTALACLMLASHREAGDLADLALAEGIAVLMRQAAESRELTVGEWYRRQSDELGRLRAGSRQRAN